jgi:hypothetical protein
MKHAVLWAVILAVTASAGATEPMQLSLAADTDTLLLGEPLAIVVEARNTGKEAAEFPSDWHGGNARVVLTISKDGGEPQTDEPWSTPANPLKERTVSLATGETCLRNLDINGYFEQPGVYTVQATFIATGKVVDPAGPRKCWGGKIVSNTLKITVKPLTEDADKGALAILSQIKPGLASHPTHIYWFPMDDFFTGGDDRFARMLKEFPKSRFARHAELAIARTHSRYVSAGRGDVKQAVKHYEKALADYADYYNTPAAKVELAALYLGQDKKSPDKDLRKKAVALLEDVVKSKSCMAPQAANLLKTAKAEDK